MFALGRAQELLLILGKLACTVALIFMWRQDQSVTVESVDCIARHPVVGGFLFIQVYEGHPLGPMC